MGVSPYGCLSYSVFAGAASPIPPSSELPVVVSVLLVVLVVYLSLPHGVTGVVGCDARHSEKTKMIVEYQQDSNEQYGCITPNYNKQDEPTTKKMKSNG